MRVSNENPVFTKPQVALFAIRFKYEDTLKKLVREDIVEKVEHSEWASPTVPIVKVNAWGPEDLRRLLCHHQQVFGARKIPCSNRKSYVKDCLETISTVCRNHKEQSSKIQRRLEIFRTKTRKHYRVA